MELIREDFSLILKYNFKIDPDVLPEVSAKVKNYYFGDKEIGPDTAEQLVDVIFISIFNHVVSNISIIGTYNFAFIGIFSYTRIYTFTNCMNLSNLLPNRRFLHLFTNFPSMVISIHSKNSCFVLWKWMFLVKYLFNVNEVVPFTK